LCRHHAFHDGLRSQFKLFGSVLGAFFQRFQQRPFGGLHFDEQLPRHRVAANGFFENRPTGQCGLMNAINIGGTTPSVTLSISAQGLIEGVTGFGLLTTGVANVVIFDWASEATAGKPYYDLQQALRDMGIGRDDLDVAFLRLLPEVDDAERVRRRHQVELSARQPVHALTCLRDGLERDLVAGRPRDLGLF
jgi:hypothetical protein